jgi:hypothetical protein
LGFRLVFPKKTYFKKLDTVNFIQGKAIWCIFFRSDIVTAYEDMSANRYYVIMLSILNKIHICLESGFFDHIGQKIVMIMPLNVEDVAFHIEVYNGTLKGKSHEIFDPRFFSANSTPGSTGP